MLSIAETPDGPKWAGRGFKDGNDGCENRGCLRSGSTPGGPKWAARSSRMGGGRKDSKCQGVGWEDGEDPQTSPNGRPEREVGGERNQTCLNGRPRSAK